MSPQRIQMSRHRPWRAEFPDAVIVARPSPWGNPFRMDTAVADGHAQNKVEARRFVVECFADVMRRGRASRWWSDGHAERLDWIRTHVHDLADRDLACWCPLDEPCHADVLLEHANDSLGTRPRSTIT